MQSLSELPTLSAGGMPSRVIIRVDYNVPLAAAKILDARRIESSYKTINAVLKKGGVPVLVAHLGKGGADFQTLAPIAKFLAKTYKVIFVADDIFSAECAIKIAAAPKGSVVLLENIRRYDGEESNDKLLAKRLASFGGYFINDAFSVSHRAHATVVGVPKLLPSFAGSQLAAEITALTPALSGTSHPFVFILGGAKVGTKLPLLARFVKTADQVVLAGSIVNNFFKAAGFEVGKSVVDADAKQQAQIKKLLKSGNVLLPVDVLVVRAASSAIAVTLEEIQKGDVIVDIGPQTTELIAEKVSKAKLVVWNGPTGWYEKGFVKATTRIAKAIMAGKTKAIIGGGDTGAVLEGMVRAAKKDPKEQAALAKRVFISTGGGAALDFLANGTLPGIKALK